MIGAAPFLRTLRKSQIKARLDRSDMSGISPSRVCPGGQPDRPAQPVSSNHQLAVKTELKAVT